jgi:hypothetical protein
MCTFINRIKCHSITSNKIQLTLSHLKILQVLTHPPDHVPFVNISGFPIFCLVKIERITLIFDKKALPSINFLFFEQLKKF